MGWLSLSAWELGEDYAYSPHLRFSGVQARAF